MRAKFRVFRVRQRLERRGVDHRAVFLHGAPRRLHGDIGFSASRRHAHDHVALLQLCQRLFLPGVGNERLGWRHADPFEPGAQCNGRFMMFRFVMGGMRATVRCCSWPLDGGACGGSKLGWDCRSAINASRSDSKPWRFSAECRSNSSISRRFPARKCRCTRPRARRWRRPIGCSARSRSSSSVVTSALDPCHGSSSNTPRRSVAIAWDALSASDGCVSLNPCNCERNSRVRASNR